MKKTTSLLMAIIMFLTTIVTSLTINSEVYAGVNDFLINTEGKWIGGASYGNSPIQATVEYTTVKDENGNDKTAYAYCIEPKKDGVGSTGPYTVDASTNITDPVLYGIILNGFPNKTPAQMGVESENEAYYVTKTAINMHTEYSTLASWRATTSSKQYIVDKAKELYTLGKTYTTITKPKYMATAERLKAEVNGTNFEQTFSVKADAVSNDYKVAITGTAPTGTKITDMSGTPKDSFPITEKFKVVFPVSSVTANGSFDLKIEGALKTNVILYGKSSNKNRQDYAIAKEFSVEDTTAKVPYTKDIQPAPSPTPTHVPTPTPTPTPTPSPTPCPSKTPCPEGEGKLKIIKLKAGTTTPLAGAEFKITKADGGVLGHYHTNASGEINLDKLPVGAYYVDEITPPDGYALDPNKHKDVIIVKDKTATLTFENKVEAKIIIKKYDKVTGKPLANAEFGIKNKGGSIIYEGITDSKGIISVDSLLEGWYDIYEIAPPDGYIMTPNKKEVQLKAGETVEVKFDNEKKPELIIKKLDSKTGEPLAKATFKVTKTEDETVSEYTTDSTGTIKITNLDPSIYTIDEVKAPTGYIIDPNNHKEIKLKAGDSKTLIFENTKQPTLTVKKIDSITKKPLAGAKFLVKHTESNTVSEYITDATGIIIIANVGKGIYTVEEISAPDGFILDERHKEIELEAGDSKTLIFENIQKPTLIITKINAITQRPIPNTSYKIGWESLTGGTEDLGTFKTDQNGQIIIPKVNIGWYVVTETIPAQGMSKPSNPVRRVYLKAGENAYLDVNTTTGTENTGSTVSTAQRNIQTNGQTSNQINNQNNQTNNQSNNQDNKRTTKNITVTSGSKYLNAKGEIIENYPLNSIVIKKIDAITSEMLEGAVFEVRKVDGQQSGTSGTIIGRYNTDPSGIIVITGLEAGQYIVEEVKAPTNYLISENSKQTTSLKADGTSVVGITFQNFPYGHILVTKVDAKTGKPLANAKFKVVDGTGAVAGNTNGEFMTDENGEFKVSNLKPNSYVVTEIESPSGYAIDTTPQTVNVGTDGKVYKINFKNQPIGSLVIKKYNSVTKEPLSNAEFKVTTAKGDVVGTNNGIYKTDPKGTIEIPNLAKGSYVVQEIKAPEGFILENQTQTIEIEYGKTHTLDFYNVFKSGLQIIKIDAFTKQPLKGAKFTVYKQNGEVVGKYETDGDGLIILGSLENGWYKVVETLAPEGYLLDDTPKDVEMKGNQFVKQTFENKKLTGLIIKKTDDKSGIPLAGANFTVTKQNGTHVGDYVTDASGSVVVPTMLPDWYIIKETKSPDGYQLDSTPQTVEVKTNVPTIVNFTNKKLTSLQIKKIDTVTGKPLAGAVFIVEKQNGEKIYTNDKGTEFVTDAQGMINIPTLTPDYYIVKEIKAPSGYTFDMTPQTVQVKTDSPTLVTFKNTPITGLNIKKLNSVTRQTIKGVVFSVAKMSGEKIGEYTTGSDGTVFVPGLLPGNYIVTEIKAVDGYELDSSPRNVNVKAGENAYLDILNTPDSGLLIIKTDAQTKKPLQGVIFDVKRVDGQRVQGNILDKNQSGTSNNSPNKSTSANGDINGSYTTDSRGRILINNLAYGEYTVTETKQLPGYELDTNVYNATVVPGKQAILQLQNKPLAGIKIIKVDAFTGQPIYNTEFMVFDTNNKVVGTFYTNNNGIIDLSAILTEGRYTIRETRASAGYFRDDVPRTAEFIAGKVTEIIWKNVPEAGQIQITKLSQDDNEMNGLPAKTPLEGAIFEIYGYKSGNLVDRFITGSDGRGVSKTLPLGRYTIKEVQAPSYYKINTTPIDATIEFATQIVKLEFTNESANVGVSIDKIGPKEVVQGQDMIYTIKTVRNNSTIPLNSFYWRDVLPTDAVRLDKIVTGTYSQNLKYKVLITTNKGNTRVIADNLMTTKNNVIGCTNAELGLPNDEYVTSFTLQFGAVKAGFSMVEESKVYTKVLKTNLPSGYQFGNKVDIGGKSGNDWVIGNSTCVTTLYSQTPNKLPKTGN